MNFLSTQTDTKKRIVGNFREKDKRVPFLRVIAHLVITPNDVFMVNTTQILMRSEQPRAGTCRKNRFCPSPLSMAATSSRILYAGTKALVGPSPLIWLPQAELDDGDLRPEGTVSNVRVWVNPRPGAGPAHNWEGRWPPFKPRLAGPSFVSPRSVAMTSWHIRSMGLASRLGNE